MLIHKGEYVGVKSCDDDYVLHLTPAMLNFLVSFNMHVIKLCKKANQKFHALARLSNYMEQDKPRLIMKPFITSQFSYCPLVWMFHSRGLNKRINKIHEKSKVSL